MEAGVRKGLGPVSLVHPIFDSVRPFFERLKDFSLEELNCLTEEKKIRTESGKPIRFVPPAPSDPYYEVHLFETGRVQTRPESKHDLFNALAWLAFPKTKARINAMHAAEIPKERRSNGGKRGRLRDMLTIFDEGGAIAVCRDDVAELLRQARWRELFVERHRDLRIVVVGHAVLEQALQLSGPPHPGITCKVIFADPARDLDAQAADWLGAVGRTPRDMPPLPVFGYPGWFPGSDRPGFYDDERYFRLLRRANAQVRSSTHRCVPANMPPGAGQAAAVSQDAEESPGSIERDAG